MEQKLRPRRKGVPDRQPSASARALAARSVLKKVVDGVMLSPPRRAKDLALFFQRAKEMLRSPRPALRDQHDRLGFSARR